MSQLSKRRSMLTTSLALAAATVAGASGAATAAAPGGTRYKVVFQVSDADPARWNLTLNNARNAQAELGADNVQVEIVAFGPGIGILKAESDISARVAEAANNGVAMLACQNTMRGQKITPEQMTRQVGYVPSGVAHLIKRQSEGYAYIRS
jgi:uncharacterized protein